MDKHDYHDRRRDWYEALLIEALKKKDQAAVAEAFFRLALAEDSPEPEMVRLLGAPAALAIDFVYGICRLREALAKSPRKARAMLMNGRGWDEPEHFSQKTRKAVVDAAMRVLQNPGDRDPFWDPWPHDKLLNQRHTEEIVVTDILEHAEIEGRIVIDGVVVYHRRRRPSNRVEKGLSMPLPTWRRRKWAGWSAYAHFKTYPPKGK